MNNYFSSLSKEHARDKYLVVLWQIFNYARQYLCRKLSHTATEFSCETWLKSVLGLARMKLLSFIVAHMVLPLYWLLPTGCILIILISISFSLQVRFIKYYLQWRHHHRSSYKNTTSQALIVTEHSSVNLFWPLMKMLHKSQWKIMLLSLWALAFMHWQRILAYGQKYKKKGNVNAAIRRKVAFSYGLSIIFLILMAFLQISQLCFPIPKKHSWT